MKIKAWGKRFCTYCGGTKMYYMTLPTGKNIGVCDCGNVDYCDRQTKEQIQARFGERLKPCDTMITID